MSFTFNAVCMFPAIVEGLEVAGRAPLVDDSPRPTARPMLTGNNR